MSLPASLFDSRIGSRVGRYVLLEHVAQGAVATVYRGSDGHTQAAIKIYDAGFIARVSIESAAQGQVDHVTVARLLDAGPLGDGGYFLASQWIEGNPLGALVASCPSWERVAA